MIHRRLAARAALVLTLSTLAASLPAKDLPRRAGLGLNMLTGAAAPPTGAAVDRVFPGMTAERLGLRPGDTILAVGGKPVAGNADVIAYAGTLTDGMPVDIRVRRGGKEMNLRGKAIGRARETYPNAKVDYGAVPFRGGGIRDIMLTPAGAKDPPVVFLIPGYSCASVEPLTPDHPYRRLGEELVARGIAYYRVEKPGMGDSAGGPVCTEIDFATELDAFRTAYKHLVKVRGVNPDRIFMFGHSLGGMQAPLLATETPPRGVAAFGTVLRNWADYVHEVGAYQGFLFYGEDVGESVAGSERSRELRRRFYFGWEAPAQIAASDPQAAEALRNMGWDGGVHTLGRSYKFNQDLAHLPLSAAWRDSKTNVLAMYGESDMVALHDEDHRLIADIADYNRPGTGRFVQIPRTGHGMEEIGNRAEVRDKARAAGSLPDGPFNPAVADALAAWIKQAMAEPPVCTRTFPARAPSPAITRG
jgi:pimeloyl-ACP methyl ester carboxylesterase